MMEQGFRGNCDSQASWGCAPALPNRMKVIFLRVMIFNHEPQAAKSSCHAFVTRRGVVRKATAFRGGANKTMSLT